MKITFERQALLRKLLSPIAKLTENCILTLSATETYSVAMSADGGIILYVLLKGLNKAITKETRLNIPNVRKLIQVFDCIDDSFIDLNVETNHLAYQSPTIKFKYFLLDDGVIEVPPIKIEKIDKLTFDSTFELAPKALKDLVKGSSFATDTNKVYFYTKDKMVFAELTDQTIQNTDSITFQVTDSFVGSELKQVLPLNMDVIRLIGDIKTEKVKVNVNTENKVLMFEISDAEHTIKFIVSSLVK